jgi:phage-related tail protein
MGLQTIFRTLGKMLMNVGAKGIADSTYRLETTLMNEDILLLQEQLKKYLDELTEFSDHLELLFKKIDVKSNKKEDSLSFLNYDFTKTKESIKQSADLLERKII